MEATTFTAEDIPTGWAVASAVADRTLEIWEKGACIGDSNKCSLDELIDWAQVARHTV